MEAFSNDLVKYVTFTYLLVWVLYLCNAIIKARAFGLAASGLAWAALAVHTAAIVMRWVVSFELREGLGPFSNLFESLVFFGWTLMVIYLIIEIRTKNKTIGAFTLPLAFFAMLYAVWLDPSIKPLMPALKSNWLIAHVITCFLGYAAFGVSAAISTMYLLGPGKTGEVNSSRALALEDLIYQTVAIGFIMLSAGIITGAIWANKAWGTYWSWDPKETWSLVTWLVYAAMLHRRFIAGWGGQRLSWFSLLGFACVMFTYFGVNFLLTGLHSYATQ